MNLETFTNPKNLLWCKPSLTKKTLESTWRTLTHWLLDDRASILPKMHFWTVWRYSAWKWAKLALVCSKGICKWLHAFLSPSTTSCNISAWTCTEIKISSFWMRKGPTSLVFSFFWFFFHFSFFSFSYLFAAVINVLLLGLLPFQKLLRKQEWNRQFLQWSS